MSDKEKYRILCREKNDIPIFSKDWWMDAVCGEENWDVILIEKNNEIIATLPYYLHKKLMFNVITQPKLTQTNGIWINYPDNQKYSSRLAYEKNVMFEIIDQIEKLNLDYFRQNFHHSITNWLPFHWKGFQQTTRYTYVINNTKNLEEVFANFSKVVRKNVRKASNDAKIYRSDDVEKFYSMNKKTFERQGINIPYTLEFIKKLDDNCKANNARAIFFAEDKDGNIHSSSYVVWDDNTVYQLMSGTDPQYRNSEFKTLLIIEALKIASKFNKTFDFEGSMIEGIEEYFRKFGAVQKPYFAISKTYSRMLKIRESLNSIRDIR